MATVFTKLPSVALGFASLFILTLFLGVCLSKTLLKTLIEHRVLALFSVSIFLISLYKAIIDVVRGNFTTLFAYLAIPVYATMALTLTIWLQEKPKRAFLLMQMYTASFCIIFMTYSNNFIIDSGPTIRSVANFYNPNEMNIYSYFSIAFAVLLIAVEKKYVYFNVFLAAVSFVATLLGKSRTAMLAIFLGAILAIILAFYHRSISSYKIRQRRKYDRSVKALIGIFIFVLSTFILLRILTPDIRTVVDARGEYYTAEGRAQLNDAYPELEIEKEQLTPNASKNDEAINTETTKLPGKNNGDAILDRYLHGNRTERSEIFTNLRLKIWEDYLVQVPDYWLIGAENRFESMARCKVK